VQELCKKYGSERVVVAIDARNGRVAIRGWTEGTSVGVLELAKQMSAIGVRRLLHTDISRDGTLTGPNFAANAALVRETGLAVLASGGIASLEHIRRLVGAGVEGVIIGRALYTGDIKLAEAITSAAVSE
jgi:phosphoribosylformimino-5-aminoimidazole carboxamide ribotide isomerase